MSNLSTRWGRFLGLGIAIGGAIAGAVSLTFALEANSASAQITPDGTLPTNSSVTLEGNTSIIMRSMAAGEKSQSTLLVFLA